jgi:ribosomal protein S18 acetylase RimI-like enzyme
MIPSKPNFSIRPLTPQDEPVLWEMLYQAIYVPEGQPAPDRKILEEPSLAHYVREWGHKPGDTGWIAEDQPTGRAVGAVWLRLFSHSDQGYGFVGEDIPELSIAILPEFRGQGLGTLLLEALIQAARQHFSAISLSVSRDNPAARLYQRMGFRTVSEDTSSLTMRKDLD